MQCNHIVGSGSDDDERKEASEALPVAFVNDIDVLSTGWPPLLITLPTSAKSMMACGVYAL